MWIGARPIAVDAAQCRLDGRGRGGQDVIEHVGAVSIRKYQKTSDLQNTVLPPASPATCKHIDITIVFDSCRVGSLKCNSPPPSPADQD